MAAGGRYAAMFTLQASRFAEAEVDVELELGAQDDEVAS